MTISTAQQTALEKVVVRTVYFVKFDFLPAAQYYNTSNVSFTWGGNTWLGLGTISSISSIEETDGLTPKALTFVLNVADQSILALAAGSVQNYSGRAATLYRCPLNEAFQLIDTPERCWSGRMDMIAIGIDGEEGSITLKCETSAVTLSRPSTLRMNASQQKLRHPTDTGFDRLESLIATPANWLSKRFQTI